MLKHGQNNNNNSGLIKLLKPVKFFI